MPIYEYKAVNPKKSCEFCIDIFEEMESIRSDPMKFCPRCGNSIERQVSRPAAFLDKNRQANQYEAAKHAKYWRDKDGNLHKTTPADGDRKSPTVSNKRTRTDEQVAAIKKRDNAIRKQKREAQSYQRYVNQVKRHKK